MNEYNLYAGYYELFVTCNNLEKPYVLCGSYKTLDAVMEVALDKEDSIFFDKEISGQVGADLGIDINENPELFFVYENGKMSNVKEP